MGVTTALEWLGSCSGCEIAILNIGEDLVPIITEALDIVHAPVLMDHKYFGQCGEGHVRCCYATSMSEIEEALRRMGRFVKRQKQRL